MPEPSLLSPINRPSVTDEVIRCLVGMILDEGLKPGDKLPSERELIAQLRVGRSSLREAIKVLSAVGAVDVLVGDGMFVGRGDTSILTKPLSWGLLLGERSTREVIEARRVVEIELAGLAAERATEEEIETIGRQLELLRASQDEPQLYTSRDLEFHLAVARAAHNRVLCQVLDTLRHIIVAWMEKVTSEYFRGKPHPGFIDHVTIYGAIRSRDVQSARQAMAAHTDAGGARLLALVARSSQGGEGEEQSLPLLAASDPTS